MRQARFASAVGGVEADARAGAAEALSFDISSKESPQDKTLAEQRVAQLHHVPILLGAISLDLFAVLFGGAVALLPAIADDPSAHDKPRAPASPSPLSTTRTTKSTGFC